jgi:hypothetical protein
MMRTRSPHFASVFCLALLALGACTADPDQSAPMNGPEQGLDGGGEGKTPVTMVPSPEQRNEADAGVVTKPKTTDDKPQSFESDLTKQASGAGIGRGGAGSLGGLAGGGAVSDSATTGLGAPINAGLPPSAQPVAPSDAERAIVEADIVQVAGNTLYALSQYGGLSLIDIADPAKLRLIGRYRELTGTPFEMYLRDSVAIVMFTSWGEYKKQSDDSYQWIQTSKVLALDTADPAAIKAIGSFDIPGAVSDSRVVGDVMYVVGYQDGYCWDCKKNQPLTSVLSLNIADPRAIARVDSLEFLGSMDAYGGGQRSIAVNTQRIYIAGPEYGQQPTSSTIQVVDISNAGGDLVAGTTVKIAGQITNRWQLDEYQNVLRVISQPFPWWTSTNQAATVVQTYTVASSQQITALGRTTLQVPPNETLRSVRFDGPRGYAITAQQTDPLITIDLSNPAQPRQVGELVMPGWVYYMEPRGNRVIGLGYDQNNPAGGITVSIFDVTNLANPRMLSRVNFGGTWASLPEDQDRIHKAFKILDQQGLMTVPFSGWSDTKRGDIYCSGEYKSGIQLIDFAGDALTLRGVAPSRGQARRAIVNGNSLLTVSDEAVDAFDITNRQSPVAQGRLTIAQNVTYALPLSNGHVARIIQDWYGSQRSTIDIIPLAEVDRPDGAVGALDLSKLLAPPTDACSGNAYIEQVFVSGNEIDLLTTRWSYSADTYTTTQGLVIIDATDPKAPKLASKLEWQASTNVNDDRNFGPWGAFSGYYSYGFIGTQASTVRTEKALVKLEQRWRYTGGPYASEVRVNVFDLSDPTKPTQHALALPKADGYAGLVRDGEDVLFSHFDSLENGARAHFFIDRIDLSDGANPKLTDKISVPGALLHYDRTNNRAITSELTRQAVPDLTSQQCWERFGYAEWTVNGSDGGVVYVPYDANSKGTCTAYLQHLHMVRFVTGGAVLDSSYHLGESERISASSMGDGRVTAVLNHGYMYWGFGVAVDCFDCGRGGIIGGGGSSKPAEVLVLGGLADGVFDVGRLTVENDSDPWWGFWGSPPVYATGTRALVQSSSDVAVVDTSVPSAPKIVSTVPLYGYANDLQAVGKLVLLSLGMNGVQRIDL